MTDKSDNIKVAVRIRGLIPREEDQKCVWVQDGENSISRTDTNESFLFNRVYGKEQTTRTIFEELAGPIMQDFMTGINGTIFAYGQTSSGKTFTMMGTESSPGIIPLCVSFIYNKIENTPERAYLVRVSYMEIYNENVVDLLGDYKKPLNLGETYEGEVTVKELKEELVKKKEDCFELLKRGEKSKLNRVNEEDDDDKEDEWFLSQLNLIDLAGSEKQKQTGSSGQRLLEGGYINKSLLTLTQVITQLSTNNSHISYRDSKLTRILQNSLGGNSKTVFICAVTPVALDETSSTVRFAMNVKSIKNKPKINEVITEKVMLYRMTKEKNALKKLIEEQDEQLQKSREEFEKKDKQLQKSREEFEKLVQQRNNAIIVSSKFNVAQEDNLFELKKKRRETWCPGKGNKARGYLKGFPTEIREETDIDESIASRRSGTFKGLEATSSIDFTRPLENQAEFSLSIAEDWQLQAEKLEMDLLAKDNQIKKLKSEVVQLKNLIDTDFFRNKENNWVTRCEELEQKQLSLFEFDEQLVASMATPIKPHRLHSSVSNNSQNEEKVINMEHKIDSLTKQLDEQIRENTNLKEEKTNLEEKFAKLEAELNDEKSSLSELKVSNLNYEEKIMLSDEKMKSIRNDLNKTNEKYDDLLITLSARDSEIEDYVNKLAAKDVEISELKAGMTEKKEVSNPNDLYNIKEMQMKLEELNKCREESELKLREYEKVLERKDNLFEELSAELSNFKCQTANLLTEIQNSNVQIVSLKKKCSLMSLNEEEQNNLIETLKSDVSKLSGEKDELLKKVEATNCKEIVATDPNNSCGVDAETSEAEIVRLKRVIENLERQHQKTVQELTEMHKKELDSMDKLHFDVVGSMEEREADLKKKFNVELEEIKRKLTEKMDSHEKEIEDLTEQYKLDSEALKNSHTEEITKLKQSYDDIECARDELDELKKLLTEEKNRHEIEILKLTEQYKIDAEALKNSHAEEITKLKQSYDDVECARDELDELKKMLTEEKNSHEIEILKLTEQYKLDTEALKNSHAEEITKLKQSYDDVECARDELDELKKMLTEEKNSHEIEILKLTEQYKLDTEALKNSHAEEITKLKQSYDDVECSKDELDELKKMLTEEKNRHEIEILKLTEQYKLDTEALKNSHTEEITKLKQSYDDIECARDELDELKKMLTEEKNSHEIEILKLTEQYKLDTEALKSSHAEEITKLKQSYDVVECARDELDELKKMLTEEKNSHEIEILKLTEQYKLDTEALKNSHAEEITKLKQSYDDVECSKDELDELKKMLTEEMNRHEIEILKLTEQYKIDTEALKNSHAEEITKLKQSYEDVECARDELVLKEETLRQEIKTLIEQHEVELLTASRLNDDVIKKEEKDHLLKVEKIEFELSESKKMLNTIHEEHKKQISKLEEEHEEELVCLNKLHSEVIEEIKMEKLELCREEKEMAANEELKKELEASVKLLEERESNHKKYVETLIGEHETSIKHLKKMHEEAMESATKSHNQLKRLHEEAMESATISQNRVKRMHEEAMESAAVSHKLSVEQLRRQHFEESEKQKEAHLKEIEVLNEEHIKKLEELRELEENTSTLLQEQEINHKGFVESVNEKHKLDMDQIKMSHQEAIESITKSHESSIKSLNHQHSEELNKLKEKHLKEMEDLREDQTKKLNELNELRNKSAKSLQEMESSQTEKLELTLRDAKSIHKKEVEMLEKKHLKELEGFSDRLNALVYERDALLQQLKDLDLTKQDELKKILESHADQVESMMKEKTKLIDLKNYLETKFFGLIKSFSVDVRRDSSGKTADNFALVDNLINSLERFITEKLESISCLERELKDQAADRSAEKNQLLQLEAEVEKLNEELKNEGGLKSDLCKGLKEELEKKMEQIKTDRLKFKRIYKDAMDQNRMLVLKNDSLEMDVKKVLKREEELKKDMDKMRNSLEAEKVDSLMKDVMKLSSDLKQVSKEKREQVNKLTEDLNNMKLQVMQREQLYYKQKEEISKLTKKLASLQDQKENLVSVASIPAENVPPFGQSSVTSSDSLALGSCSALIIAETTNRLTIAHGEIKRLASENSELQDKMNKREQESIKLKIKVHHLEENVKKLLGEMEVPNGKTDRQESARFLGSNAHSVTEDTQSLVRRAEQQIADKMKRKSTS